jgi:HEAT repeat protein
MNMPQSDVSVSLQDRLSHTSVAVRRAAVRELVESGGPHLGITAAVLALVVDRDDPTRQAACEALDRVIMPAPEELGSLIEIMRSACDGEVEYWTATMLGRLGASAARATGVLASALLDSSCLAARERAAWALTQIGPPARSSLNALRQIGKDDPPRLRRLAETAMQSLSGRAA